ncbi:MAG: EutN/CcmL family microcompartment protein [Planctomycetota bacterium]|nr:EutN/CcmL family microcompartment protein [Planctomycetota bacterium]
MLVGRVVGNVWATQKDPSLEGVRMLLVRPFNGGRTIGSGESKAGSPPGAGNDEADELVVAADRLGAGIGETVLVAFGRAARTVLGSQDIAWQAAVVGIVDSISLQHGGTFELSDDGERSSR